MKRAAGAARPAAVQAVFDAMERIAPTRYAGGWDNVGLLVDTPTAGMRGGRGGACRVFLTNDLTYRVAEEAVRREADVVVTYHPTPFGKFRTLRRDDPAGRVVLLCASSGVAVYSPHSALDAAPRGITDWLISPFATAVAARPIENLPAAANADPGAGNGRIVDLPAPVTLRDAVARVKEHLRLDTVRVAPAACDAMASHRTTAQTVAERAGEIPIHSVAVCCGSGGSVLAGCGADLWVTGEMSHHDVLAANATGASVILTEHSNSERGYLPTLRDRLLQELGLKGQADGEQSIFISELDSDPLVTI